jgi:hypothetical protein
MRIKWGRFGIYVEKCSPETSRSKYKLFLVKYYIHPAAMLLITADEKLCV